MRTLPHSRLSSQRRSRYVTGILLMTPTLCILLVMMLTPLLRTFEYSVSKIKFPALTTTYVGFANFKKVFSRSDIAGVLQNTVVWILWSVALRFTFGFGSALLLHDNRRTTKIYRVLALLPWTIPSIVSANTWRWIYQSELGLANQMLKALGLGAWMQNWLGNPATAMGSVLFAYSWAGFPFVMMMLLAGIQGIPDELYESGKIDGANAWQLFCHITIPELKSVIFAVLILEVTSGLNSFDLLFTMTGGGPGGVTKILGLLIHEIGFVNFDFGSASALSVFIIGIAFVVFLVSGPTKKIAQQRKGGAGL